MRAGAPVETRVEREGVAVARVGATAALREWRARIPARAARALAELLELPAAGRLAVQALPPSAREQVERRANRARRHPALLLQMHPRATMRAALAERAGRLRAPAPASSLCVSVSRSAYSAERAVVADQSSQSRRTSFAIEVLAVSSHFAGRDRTNLRIERRAERVPRCMLAVSNTIA